MYLFLISRKQEDSVCENQLDRFEATEVNTLKSIIKELHLLTSYHESHTVLRAL